MKTIIRDERVIKSIHWPDESQIVAGENGVEKIVAYQEHGYGSYITWLAIYRNGVIDQRINTAFLDSIIYS